MVTVQIPSRNGVERTTGQRVEKVFVTPEMAGQWLARNTNNRRLSKGHVQTLEAVLGRGEWMLNGETIKFANDGRLLDGQHRLHACVSSGVGFWTYVAYGVESDAFDTIDTNMRTRRTSDILGVHGKENASQLASCVKVLWVFSRTGQFYEGGGPGLAFSPKVCLDILERRPGICDAVSRCGQVRVFSSPSLLAALYYLFSCSNPDLAGEFASVMADGSSELERPFHILRESVISRRLTVRRIGIRQLAFMAIRAWNSELSSDWIKRVYYKPNEEFPEIAGLNYERLSADYV